MIIAILKAATLLNLQEGKGATDIRVWVKAATSGGEIKISKW